MTEPRWRIALLLSAAIAISYLDRQALPVAIAAIQRDIPITNVQFSQLQVAFLLAYALMYAGGGELWTCSARGAGSSRSWCAWSLALRQPRAGDRLPLARSSAGSCSAWAKAAAFRRRRRPCRSGSPRSERSTAMGIINAGTAVGAVVAPPRSPLILHVRELALGVLRDGRGRACSGRCGGCATTRRRLAGRPRREPTARRGAGDRPWVAAALAFRAGLGPGRREVPERRGLVLLPVLAAEVSLRRARLRHEAGRAPTRGFPTRRPASAASWAGGSRAGC